MGVDRWWESQYGRAREVKGDTLVERLLFIADHGTPADPSELCAEAAASIEALQAQIVDLKRTIKILDDEVTRPE